LQRLTAINPKFLSAKPKDVVLDAAKKNLKVIWDGEEACEDSFSADWLLSHSLEPQDQIQRRTAEVAEIEGYTRAQFEEQKPIDFRKIIAESDSTSKTGCNKDTLAFIDRLWKHGLVLVENVPDSNAAKELCDNNGVVVQLQNPFGQKGDDDHASGGSYSISDDFASPITQLARRISFLRETNYGRIFDVRSKAQANNQAYTQQALPLHTDLPFYKNAPDIQFLHCIRQSDGGGESVFVDGVSAALKLRETDYSAYRILADTKVRYSDDNAAYELHDEKPIIFEEELSEGELTPTRLYLNEGVRCHVMNGVDWTKLNEFYSALIKLQNIIDHDEELVIRHRLKPGTLVAFNNNRMMHGRSQFTASGERHLQGGYIDWDDCHSRRRVLQRSMAAE